MPKIDKKTKNIKKTKTHNDKSNRKKNNKSRRKNLKAGNGNKVQCCMCEKTVNKNDTLVPSSCSLMHGERAHRICQKCWWDPKTGFARENASHKCPGCQKSLPLTTHTKKAPIFVDLTEE